eukprot:GHVL01010447.1.p1 GENE.GHVL01010447.1~~GHVL01010447.1.p1  ORF type:complete len:305 (+),score=57.87 GHVL01010447.1:85-999(+)
MLFIGDLPPDHSITVKWAVKNKSIYPLGPFDVVPKLEENLTNWPKMPNKFEIKNSKPLLPGENRKISICLKTTNPPPGTKYISSFHVLDRVSGAAVSRPIIITATILPSIHIEKPTSDSSLEIFLSSVEIEPEIINKVKIRALSSLSENELLKDQIQRMSEYEKCKKIDCNLSRITDCNRYESTGCNRLKSNGGNRSESTGGNRSESTDCNRLKNWVIFINQLHQDATIMLSKNEPDIDLEIIQRIVNFAEIYYLVEKIDNKWIIKNCEPLAFYLYNNSKTTTVEFNSLPIIASNIVSAWNIAK